MFTTYLLLIIFGIIGTFQILNPEKAVFILWRKILGNELSKMSEVLFFVRLAGLIIVIISIYSIISL